MCANKVVACGRCSTLLTTIRPQNARQSAPAQQIIQLEGLAVAIPWGFESPFRTNKQIAESPSEGFPRAALIAEASGRLRRDLPNFSDRLWPGVPR
jgi:hypothetical protein